MFLRIAQSIISVVRSSLNIEPNTQTKRTKEPNTYQASISNNSVSPVDGKSQLLMIVSVGIMTPIRIYTALINISLIVFLFCFSVTNVADFLIPLQNFLTTKQVNAIKSINCIAIPMLLFSKSFIVLIVVLMSTQLNQLIVQYRKRKAVVC